MATKAFGFFDNQVKIPESASNPLLSVEDRVDIISLHGPMMRNPDLISRLLFDALDIEDAMDAVNEAAQRDDVAAILLDIDSPGGTVNGTPELGQAVRLPSDTRQYLRASVAVDAAGGNNTALKFSLALVF